MTAPVAGPSSTEPLTTLAWNVSPAAPSVEYMEMMPPITICRDVMGGTEPMRQRRTDYLPRGSAEGIRDYNARLREALLFNALRRTVNGLVGMVFRAPPRLSAEVPQAFKDHWENIDNRGTPGPKFLKDTARDALVAGHAGILVDYPRVTPGQSVADVKKLGVRPFWVRYRAEDILRVETGEDHGRMVLERVVLRETLRQPGYTRERPVQFRVFLRGEAPLPGANRKTLYEVWRPTAGNAKTLERTDAGLLDQEEIPFHLLIAEAETETYGVTEPPLLDLAYCNIRHYQVSSEFSFGLHIGLIPIPIFIGRDTTKKTIAASSKNGVDLPIGADAKYLEPSGKAYEVAQNELGALEQRMAALGLAMLQRETRAAETAEAKAMDKAESDSALTSFATNIEAAANACLKTHGAWLDVTPEQVGKIALNRDFLGIRLTPQDVTAVQALHAAGEISLDTLWDILERGDVLPPGFDREKERQRLEEEEAARPPLQLILPGMGTRPAQPQLGPDGKPVAAPPGATPPAPPGSTPPAPPAPQATPPGDGT